VVVVADRERVGEGVLVGQVPAGVVGHGGHALVGHPLVVLPGVPCGVGVVPAVGGIRQEGLAEVRHVRAERQQVARAVRLVPHTLSRRKRHRVRVREPSDPPHHAEVVVE
jgi:hypothetical protein